MEEILNYTFIGQVGLGGNPSELNNPTKPVNQEELVNVLNHYHYFNNAIPTGGNSNYMSPAKRQEYNDQYNKNLENRIYNLEDEIRHLNKTIEYLMSKIEPFVKIENARNIINS